MQAKIISIAHERRRFGYRRIGILLKREGIKINHKKVYRLYKEAGLKVRKRGGRKRGREERKEKEKEEEEREVRRSIREFRRDPYSGFGEAIYPIAKDLPTAHDYVYSDRERDAKLVAGQAAGRRIPKDNGIQRYKGLGEMDYTELWDTTMDPDHRTLLQVTMDDALAADQIFSVLMGEDVESRRNFIQQNAKDVRFLDI